MNYFQIPAISNSSLSTFNYDPSYYYKVHVTKELHDRKESASLTFGSLVHCLILEPEEIPNRYVVSTIRPEDKPSGMMLEFINALLEFDIVDDISIDAAYAKSGYKISKEKVLEAFNKSNNQLYYNEMVNSKGKSLVLKNEFDLAVQCANIAMHNPQWAEILGEYSWNTFKELEITWEEYGLQFKSKLDHVYVRRTGDTLFVKYFDYKTDSQKPVYKYIETFEYWKTYRQMAFYEKALRMWLKQTHDDVQHVHIVMYLVPIDVMRLKSLIYNVDKSYIEKGTKEINEDINNLLWHMETNQWEYPRSVYQQLEGASSLTLFDKDYYMNLGLSKFNIA
jgi:hypothetical protein